MFFGQKTHPLNFEYGNRLSVADDYVQLSGNTFSTQIRCEEITDFCTKVSFDNTNVADKRHYSEGLIEQYRQGRSIQPQHGEQVIFTTAGGIVDFGASKLKIQMASGIRLETIDQGIGFNGEKFVLNFNVEEVNGFYGFGERTKRLNKSGDSLDFWNVDVVAVFPYAYERDDYDPAYAAIPFAIIKAGDIYGGIYFDNPGRVVIDVEHSRMGQLMYQSMAGNTDVYFVNGPSLRQVVRNFTILTGRAEMPPLWSMGYHQSRWGYQAEADFTALKDDFQKFDIPVSAFWYDIDYMDEYRVFTWDRKDFSAPAELNNVLKEAGIRTVTIIDPGVKLESGYPVYDQGKQLEVFCKTASGRDYVGRVWPGDTVFPDFTLESARDWWADHVARFLQESAIDGVWLDMNDPSTGFSIAEDMLFEHGSVTHDRYHNQYANLMAQASLKGSHKIDPQARPFLLTRSAFTGIQRYSAVWTGDNASNWRHLRMSIPCTINLGLSGVAFNGPDVGGFMGHTTPELLVRWYQAGFLFPFFRNHTMLDSKAQEPWQFGTECLAYVRETIKTRYRLMPYLYNCFFEHYLTGDPILRPLMYEYEGREFENLDDQFLIGGQIMVAPILYGEGQGREIVTRRIKCQLRSITFPPGWWFDLNMGEWIEGDKTIRYAAGLDEVPLFIRDGSIIPYYQGPLRNSFMDLKKLELHIFSKEEPGSLNYFIDDRQTRRYQTGDYNTARIDAQAGDGQIQVSITEQGNYQTGTVEFTPVLYGHQGEWQVVILVNGQSKTATLNPSTRQWVCKSIEVLA